MTKRNNYKGKIVMKKIPFTLLLVLINTVLLKPQTFIDLVIEESHILNKLPSPQGIAWDGNNFWVTDNYTFTLNKLSADLESIDTTLFLRNKIYGDLTFDGENFAIVDNLNHEIIKIKKNNPLEINIFNLPITNLITGITWDEPNLYISFEAGWSSQIAKLEPEMDSVSFVSYTKGVVTGLTSSNNNFFYCYHNLGIGPVGIFSVASNQTNSIIYQLPSEIKYPSGVEIISGCFWVIDFGTKTLYKLKEDPTLSSGKEILINPEETLFQNYPNPFNPTTQIQYVLPNTSNVIVTVYNSLGQTVKVFNEGTKEAGNHNITFNGEGLSSGIYLYNVHSVSIDGKQTFTAAKKMLLLK